MVLLLPMPIPVQYLILMSESQCNEHSIDFLGSWFVGQERMGNG